MHNVDFFQPIRDNYLIQSFIVLKFLNHPLQYLRFVIPRFLADKIYNLVAKKRYNWFGKKDQCIFPTGNSQFLID